MPGHFEISISDARLAEIRDKVRVYDWSRWPDAGGWDAGVAKGDLKRLTDYWSAPTLSRSQS